jgi:O-antigen/teichoic acid export membrane protein
MKLVFKDLLGKGLVYGLGSSLSGLAGFILIPFFIRHLSAAQYGRYALAEMLFNIFLIIVGLGLNVPLLARYANSEGKERDLVVGGVFALSLISGLVFSLIFCLLPYTSIPLMNRLTQEMVILVAAVVVTETLWQRIATLVRAKGQAIFFSVTNLAKMLASLGLTVFLISVWGMREEGILYGRLAGNALVLLSSFGLHGRYPLIAGMNKALELLKAGWPLVPSALLAAWLTAAPLFFVERFCSIDEIGIYAISTKIAGFLLLIMIGPLNMVYSVMIYSIFKRSDAEQIYARILTYYVLIGLALSLSLAFAGPGLADLFGRNEFHVSSVIIILVSFAFFVYGISYVVTVGFYVCEKTKAMVPAFLLTALLSLPLVGGLTYWFGITGAAAGYMLGFVFLAVALNFLSQRLYRVRYEYRRIGKAFLAAMLAGVASFVLSPAGGLGQLLVAIFFVAGFIVCLFLFRFFDEKERRHIQEFFVRHRMSC